eukprot:TRINITY_DN8992_c0_g1_i1.p1 TRINITY_DN8992_c0_g1~~TRINITY_DN8992_c0_g1_i1.p1  ORF type:complete len:121 (+),score=12.95 TRINITY_DN8992_c0_g1_i1:16-378(+)
MILTLRAHTFCGPHACHTAQALWSGQHACWHAWSQDRETCGSYTQQPRTTLSMCEHSFHSCILPPHCAWHLRQPTAPFANAAEDATAAAAAAAAAADADASTNVKKDYVALPAPLQPPLC